MKNLTKTLIVRLTEQQVLNLTKILVDERMTKSQLARDALTKYIKDKHKELLKTEKSI